MNCCVNCFSDQGLKSRIEAQSTIIGNCDFCESIEVTIIVCGELSEFFEPIFEFYTNHPTANLSLGIDKPLLLHQHLVEYWSHLFNLHKLKSKDIKQLINQIGRGCELYSDALFEKPVELKLYLEFGDIPDRRFELQWNAFAEGIKRSNRFFIKEELDLELLEMILTRFTKVYPINHEFYRSRISDKPLSIDELGKPAFNKASPGRANPVGIPYLYVSESEETTLYETRISLHESATIGKFKLVEPLQVISLKSIANYGPFAVQDLGFELDEFVEYRPYLLMLESQLSKPVRKQDVHLDYLPTQFLCEYIKSLGFDAIEYGSSMKIEGYNLAIFNDQKLECIDAKFYQVKNLKYVWK